MVSMTVAEITLYPHFEFFACNYLVSACLHLDLQGHINLLVPSLKRDLKQLMDFGGGVHRMVWGAGSLEVPTTMPEILPLSALFSGSAVPGISNLLAKANANHKEMTEVAGLYSLAAWLVVNNL